MYGPEWFADSTYAGIVPGSYACEDRFSCAYIGEVWNYTRSDEWKNDDNCGWGSCYRDHAGQLTIGNTHDYATLHGHVLQQMGISYVSCTAEMAEVISNQDSVFRLIDYICGRQKQPLTANSQAFIAKYMDNGGCLLISTDHFSAIDPIWAKRYVHASSYASHATRSGRIRIDGKRVFQLVMEPNEEQLFSCHPEGLKAEEGAVKIATYEDMHVPAAIGTPKKSIVFGFPLEAVRAYEKLYQQSIEWILNND